MNAPSIREACSNDYRLFFSHGGEDAYIVQHFLREQVEKTGAKVFLDTGRIHYGDDFREKILKELASCDELLVLVTRSSLKRPWVLAEIGAALVRGKRIVAVLYGPTTTELEELSVLSLLGQSHVLVLDNFGEYLSQLKSRVESLKDV